MQPSIDEFFEKHPEKRESVIFTGPIYDKKKLWEYYNRAKVFVLNSRWEGYPLVLGEARRFGNYLVSTPLDASFDVVAGRYGELVPQEDAATLARALQRIVDGRTDTDVYTGHTPRDLSWEDCLRPVVEKLSE